MLVGGVGGVVAVAVAVAVAAVVVVVMDTIPPLDPPPTSIYVK